MTFDRQPASPGQKFPERAPHLDNFVGSIRAAHSKIETWQELLAITDMEEEKKQALTDAILKFEQAVETLKSGQIIQYSVEDLQNSLRRLDTNRLDDSNVIHNLIKQIESDAQELITRNYRY